MPVNYVPSQDDRTKQTTPLQYTQSPLRLLWCDIKWFALHLYTTPGIIFPLTFRSGPRDELYPSASNLFDIVFHTILIVAQLLFLATIPPSPLFFTVPLGLFLAWVAFFLVVNRLLCGILNGKKTVYHSNVDISQYESHPDEQWVFINGVSVGEAWLMSNLNQLSLIFKRPITGIHNLTYGIVFDLIECLIQRDFTYATQDTRTGYAEIKKRLENPTFKKVVLIVHSQGCIEGGQIVDWLLADLPEDFTSKLEIYTFGNAANHFNNPITVVTKSTTAPPPPVLPNPAPQRVIKNIEHYANSGDTISMFGVLNFIYSRSHDNRFVGKLFERRGSGHMLNQHYLDNMFTLDPVTLRVLESNPFMETEVDVETVMNDIVNGIGLQHDGNHVPTKKKVKELSRLWEYRNGSSPQD